MGQRLGKAAAFLAGLLPLLAAGGCATEVPMPHFPELTYGHLGRVTLDVARIEIDTKYTPPLKPPNVEHRAPVPPYELLRRWGEQRLVAGGRSGAANLVILDASIRETRLPVTVGVKGMFTREQGARYEGRAAVMLEIRDVQGRQRAFVTAQATRSATVPEGAPIVEREKVWFTMTEDLVAEINRNIEQEIQAHLAPYRVGG